MTRRRGDQAPSRQSDIEPGATAERTIAEVEPGDTIGCLRKFEPGATAERTIAKVDLGDTRPAACASSSPESPPSPWSRACPAAL